MPSDTSSVIVLPIRVAPASSSRSTAHAWRVGVGWSRGQSGFPPPVGWPATSKRSLAANVSPASGPSDAPATRMEVPGTNGLVTGAGLRYHSKLVEPGAVVPQNLPLALRREMRHLEKAIDRVWISRVVV